MPKKRKIEIFSAGCPLCKATSSLVKNLSCPSCEIEVMDMNSSKVAGRAKKLGIRSVPAVVIDGKVTDCCLGHSPDEDVLRSAGLGQPL